MIVHVNFHFPVQSRPAEPKRFIDESQIGTHRLNWRVICDLTLCPPLAIHDRDHVSQGYAPPQREQRLTFYGDFDHLPETTVFVALRQNKLVGSVSVTLDGPWGLTVDKDFRIVCDLLRYAGRSLAVVWRLVMKDFLKPSRRVLRALLQETIDRSALYGANSTLFAVDPRYKSLYQKLLRATEVSVNGCTKGLTSPTVLLRYDYELLPPSWKRLAESAQKP